MQSCGNHPPSPPVPPLLLAGYESIRILAVNYCQNRYGLTSSSHAIMQTSHFAIVSWGENVIYVS